MVEGPWSMAEIGERQLAIMVSLEYGKVPGFIGGRLIGLFPCDEKPIRVL